MANLNDLTTEITNIKTDIFTCYNELKDVLDTMNIPTDNCKMLDMIDKVGGFKRFAATMKAPEWLEFSYGNKWEKADSTPLGTEHTAYASAVVGTKIYIIGGYTTTDDDYTYYNTNHCYDTETGEWSTKKAMPAAITYHSAAAVGTKIYVMGGYDDSSLSTNYCYDTETDSWTTMTSMPAAIAWHPAASVGTKIYVMGGHDGADRNTNYCYDTETDSWTTMKAMPAKRSEHSAVAVGTKIYVMGGCTGTSTYYNTNYCYDTETNSWTTMAAMTVKRSEHSAAVVGLNVYVFGESYTDGNSEFYSCYIV